MVCCFPSQVLKKLREATTKQITHGKSLKFLTVGNRHPRWNESHKNPCDIESTRESGSVQLPKRIFERKKVGSFLWWVISKKTWGSRTLEFVPKVFRGIHVTKVFVVAARFSHSSVFRDGPSALAHRDGPAFSPWLEKMSIYEMIKG